MLDIQLKPIIVGTIVFAILFCITTIVNNNLSPNTGQYVEIIWIDLSGFLIFIIAGYAAAKMAKTWGIAYGAAIGVFATLIMAIYYSILTSHINKDFEQHWYLWLAFSIVFGGLGGLIWDLKKLIVRKVFKN